MGGADCDLQAQPERWARPAKRRLGPALMSPVVFGYPAKAAVAVLKTDPLQLPAATTPGQTPDGVFTYGRSLAAGQTYVDPLSGVTVLKLTDSTHPISNA